MEQLETMTIQHERGLLPEAQKQVGTVKEKFLEMTKGLFEKRGEGARDFPWKSLSVRNLLIAGCAVLILLAAYLNLRFAQDSVIGGGGDAPPLVDSQGASNVDDDYFAVAVINRSRVRDEAIDMYQAVADDETASVTSREAAYASMNALVDRTAAEVDIENRIKAKGFSNCVAILENERANVIVQTEGLTDAEVAQITEIVYLEAGVIPQNLTITEKV